MDHATEPKGHLVGRIQEALAEDDRTNTLDIQIQSAGGKIFLLGTVSSETLRDDVEHVVCEVTGPYGIVVVNDLKIVSFVEGSSEEHVRS